jgi:hypothetical protein
MNTSSPVPVAYLALMSLCGAGFAFVVQGHPELQAGALSPLVWLILVALAYELSQKFAPKLHLAPIVPIQRFAGYFVGAVIYLVLLRALN